LQKRTVKVKGLDLIRRISIQRLGTKAIRLTGVEGLTRGQIAIWAVDRRSGGSGLAQARQRRGAWRGGRPPAANAGDAARGTGKQTICTGRILTLRRSFGAAPRRPEGGDGAGQAQQRDTSRRRCGDLGFGRREAALGLGVSWRRLRINRQAAGGGGRLRAGPRPPGLRRSDSETTLSRSRPEVGDDARAPRVSGWRWRVRGRAGGSRWAVSRAGLRARSCKGDGL
jgi:hypothetical protein